MLWRVADSSTAAPAIQLEEILDKDSFTLEELLDVEGLVPECKLLNLRLINFLRDRAQVEKLVHYIIEDAPEDAELVRKEKFPYIACGILICEVEIILRTLVEDEELMNLLFSFLKPGHSHDTKLGVYFSMVVKCLMLHKATPLTRYVQGHPEIFHELVDLIGIASMKELLVLLIGADSTEDAFPPPPAEIVHLLEQMDLLETILDKISSSDSSIVQANATDILCATIDYAPSQIAAKICSPSFVRRLFCHALNDSQPIKTVLVHSLAVCISLLDPERLASASNQLRTSNSSHGSLVTASHETVECMLESLGNLLELLDISSSGDSLPTTYGSLKPPLGRYRVKIVQFISVLLKIGSEAAEKKLLHLKAVKHVLDLFFQYPFNNVFHCHVVEIVLSCLDSKNTKLTENLFFECDILGRILEAEKQPTLSPDCNKPTVSTPGKSPPMKGNFGHLTQIANKIVELADKNSFIQTRLKYCTRSMCLPVWGRNRTVLCYRSSFVLSTNRDMLSCLAAHWFKENKEWSVWQNSVLFERNKLEDVCLWECGRPSSSQGQAMESDDDDQQKKYAVAELANELSRAFRYGIYSIDDIEEAQRSLEKDDAEAEYFDDESADAVISSLCQVDGQEGSLFTNSNWFKFEDTTGVANVRSSGSTHPNSSKEGENQLAGEVANDDGEHKNQSLDAEGK